MPEEPGRVLGTESRALRVHVCVVWVHVWVHVCVHVWAFGTGNLLSQDFCPPGYTRALSAMRGDTPGVSPPALGSTGDIRPPGVSGTSLALWPLWGPRAVTLGRGFAGQSRQRVRNKVPKGMTVVVSLPGAGGGGFQPCPPPLGWRPPV